jgi:hypothetical protein
MTSGIGPVTEALQEPLQEVGFRRQSGETFTIELTTGVLGWLGLNHATRYRPPGQVQIFPIAGIHHRAVERLITELRGDKPRRCLTATVSTPIGRVMPVRGYVTWEFGGQYGMAAMPDLIAAIVDYGLPFMQSLTELPAVLDAVQQGLCHNPEYRLPAVLEVMGRHDEAVAAVSHAVDELGQRQDPAARQLRDFAAAFMRRV